MKDGKEKGAELEKTKEALAALEARANQPSESELSLRLQATIAQKKLAFVFVVLFFPLNI